ncbi:unnamed protein product [Tilletia controversa]|uniref:Protein PBN1 n=3 Tax=Tilletia TaxID=13289 RepID=A0A8X7SWI8_9BASI|nr:hypothetical protein CF336_g4197 [Tilletia laevis]KAE8197342.1 hypothetical protein CF328_g3876 [Tilletia controversa]KAE8261156.1 hypothetical protein A4X03_0g3496 [Tilletia caries]KAE8205191.1 hypothetical protein CF335_g2392 [Tilletia laevis]KAE8247284.1 hypothetical protein A4X06_0g4567 [Tilletia controversa]
MLWVALAVLLLLAAVRADTEQAQVGPFLCFADSLGLASEAAASRLSQDWPVLKAAPFPSTFSLPIAAEARRRGSDHDEFEVDSKLGAWVVLDLLSSNAHSLRASWPGSFPAEITLDIFDTEAMLARGGVQSTTQYNKTSPPTEEEKEEAKARNVRWQRPCRRAYAQVIAWRKGVATPSPHHPPRLIGRNNDESNHGWIWPYPRASPTDARGSPQLVPLHLTLEPLLLGAVPRTAIVFLLSTLIPLLAVAWWVAVPVVIQWASIQLDGITGSGRAPAALAAETRLKSE